MFSYFVSQIEYAKEFFDNIADYSLWLYAVTEYYQGNEVTIKKKIVKKYFDNYKNGCLFFMLISQFI